MIFGWGAEEPSEKKNAPGATRSNRNERPSWRDDMVDMYVWHL